jgi:CRISPR-associated protein Cas5h
MRVVRFRYRGKVGHFLRAEANVDGLTYPVPPPTALLGLAGAVLGFGKDEPQEKLAGARFAVAAAGALPLRFWHTTNVRKDPPAGLPFRVRATDAGPKNPKPEKNMRFAQEWLWKPEYRVWAALPGAYHGEFTARLFERRWHFTPCLGLAWMFADLDEAQEVEAEPLEAEVHPVATVAPQDAGAVEMQDAFAGGLTLQSLRMACAVTGERAFSHQAYWLEISGKPFPFRTAQAFRCGEDAVVWL